MHLMISGKQRFEQLLRRRHWGIIVPEDNNNKDNNTSVIPLLRQFIK